MLDWSMVTEVQFSGQLLVNCCLVVDGYWSTVPWPLGDHDMNVSMATGYHDYLAGGFK